MIFKIKANRFLRNMVRAIVGTLIHVGLKKISLNEFEEIIISQDRTKAGPSAPAHALYLTNITYPKEIIFNE
jgi:tRNA pseudouridine38-40 synthase